MTTWDDIEDRFIDASWFDYEGRPKTLKAVETFARRLTDVELDRVTFDERFILFAPVPGKYGETKGLFGEGAAFIYLSPELESVDQDSVDSTVAHEFAHMLLGHHLRAWRVGDEKEADEMIKGWGFAAAYNKDGTGPAI